MKPLWLLAVHLYLIQLVIHMRYCQMWISKELKGTKAFQYFTRFRILSPE